MSQVDAALKVLAEARKLMNCKAMVATDAGSIGDGFACKRREGLINWGASGVSLRSNSETAGLRGGKEAGHGLAKGG